MSTNARLLTTTFSSAVVASAVSQLNIKRRFRSLLRNLGVMASPQSTNLTRRGKRRRLSAPLSADGGSSSSALLENGELVGDTQTKDVTAEICSVLEEPPPQQEASSAPLKPDGKPPTGAKWNFYLDTPGATLTLPPVSADWTILKSLPTEEHAIMPKAMFRGLQSCIKRHRDDVVG